jgi:hypothetical protein
LSNRDSAKKRRSSAKADPEEGRLSGPEPESVPETVSRAREMWNSVRGDVKDGRFRDSGSGSSASPTLEETYPHDSDELDVPNPSLDPKLTEIKILKSELGDVEIKLDSFKKRLDSLEQEDTTSSKRRGMSPIRAFSYLKDAAVKKRKEINERLQEKKIEKIFKQADGLRTQLTEEQLEKLKQLEQLKQLNILKQSSSPPGGNPDGDNESSSDTHLPDSEDSSDSGYGSALDLDRVSSSSDYGTPYGGSDEPFGQLSLSHEDNVQPIIFPSNEPGQPQSTSFNNPSVINEDKIIKFIQDYDEKYKDTDRPLRDNLDPKEIKQILEKTTDNDVHDCSRQEFEKTDYGSTCHWAKNKEGNYCHNPSRSFGGNEENCKTKGIMGVLTKQQAAEKIAKEIRAAYNTTRRNASRVTNPKAGAKKTKKSNKQQSSKSSKRNIKNKKKISHRTVKN